MDSDFAFALASVLAALFFLVLLTVSILVPFMLRSIHHTLRKVLVELHGINRAIGDSRKESRPS